MWNANITEQRLLQSLPLKHKPQYGFIKPRARFCSDDSRRCQTGVGWAQRSWRDQKVGERKLEIRLITASQPTSIVVFYLIAGCKGFPDSSVCVLPMVQMGYACVCVCLDGNHPGKMGCSTTSRQFSMESFRFAKSDEMILWFLQPESNKSSCV